MEPPSLARNEAVPELPASPAGGRSRRFLHPAWFTLAAVLMAVGVQLAVHWHLPMPQCLLRKFTGLPCPTCGCTRSLLAWSTLDPVAAVRFNPLFSILPVALAAWWVAWSIEQFSGRAFLSRWRTRAARWPVGRIFIALAVVNWLYLCFALPR